MKDLHRFIKQCHSAGAEKSVVIVGQCTFRM